MRLCPQQWPKIGHASSKQIKKWRMPKVKSLAECGTKDKTVAVRSIASERKRDKI